MKSKFYVAFILITALVSASFVKGDELQNRVSGDPILTCIPADDGFTPVNPEPEEFVKVEVWPSKEGKLLKSYIIRFKEVSGIAVETEVFGNTWSPALYPEYTYAKLYLNELDRTLNFNKCGLREVHCLRYQDARHPENKVRRAVVSCSGPMIEKKK